MPSPTAAAVTPAASPTPSVSPLRAALREAAEKAGAKPRFRGELGPFTVIDKGQDHLHFQCPQNARAGPGDPHNPQEPLTELQRSELFFSLPGAQLDAVGACGDKIVSIRQIVGAATVGRGLFDGPDLQLSYDAPEDRLRLTTVAGRPALEELPVSLPAGSFKSQSQLVVIERLPSGNAPGLFLWVQTREGLDNARALANNMAASTASAPP